MTPTLAKCGLNGVATHEAAGHALVCQATGLCHGTVSIVPNPLDGTAGRVNTGPGHVPMTRETFALMAPAERRTTAGHHLAYTIAGAVAVARAYGDVDLKHTWDGLDYSHAFLLAMRGWPESDPDAVLDEYWTLVDRLLAIPRVWSTGQALTEMLLERREMTYADVTAVAQKHLGSLWGRIWVSSEPAPARQDGNTWITLGELELLEQAPIDVCLEAA